MRSIRHWLRGLLAASSLFAGVAAAQSYDHSVYLDLDNNAATGCNVTTAAGPVNGAEVRLTATVTGTPPMVTGSTRAQCAGAAFGSAQPISGSYAVGLNNGIGGSDVVELATALAGLGQGGTVRVTFVSTGAGGADLASGLVQLPGGGVLVPAVPVLVPATGIIALLVVVGLVLILARRHPAFGSSVALLLLLGAGVVWAANYMADGQVIDWASDSPLTSDPNNDSTTSDSHIEIVSVFAATESGNLFLRVDVLDAQTGANAAPVLGDITLSVAENSANATVVGTLAATDADAGQTLTYSITAGNASGAFAINAATGAITVANATLLDFETTASHALTVSVTDNGTPPLNDSAAVTINVTNVNEAPVLADATRAVAEDSPAGTAVGAPLGGTDPDAGATLTYAITAGNTNGAFAVDNAGQLTVANAAEVSTTGTFTLTVTLTDNGGLSDTATITVNVSDQNDAPTFTGEPYAFTLAENSAAATAVGNTPATDTDAGQTLAFAITAGNTGGAFAVDAAGQITVANAAAIDFETNPTFTLTVTATDDAATPMSDTATVTVTLTDVNEAPVLADATRAVAEDSAAATPVGAPLGGTDPDAGATLTYAITAGNTNGAFAVDNAGQLTVANAAEVSTTGTFTLTVTLTDNGGLSDTATITVNVSDQNDAPTFTGEPYAFTLAENSAAATVVGSTPATDTDAGQTLAFAITAGNTGGAFAIDAAGQITVANAAAIDFEANPTFTLTVTATDDGAAPMSDTASVTVTITDVNEAPVAADASFAVAENASSGTPVGTATATDPDIDPPNPPSANATLAFAITAGNTGNVFTIDANTGVISTAGTPTLLDSPYVLTVTVTDGGALSDTATITITVTDQNDAPTLNDAAFSLPENSANGTAVGMVTATDPDVGQTFTYSITAGNGAGGFAIDANTGAITVADSLALDFEVTPSFSLTVTAIDSGAPPLSDTATVSITLTDVNDAPVASDMAFTVAENSANATVVGTYTATDQDAGQTLGYSITGGPDAALFAIDASSGQITVANSAGLDFESGVVRLLQITATDDGAGNLSDIATVLITLTDVNEAPTANDANFSVPEDSAAGTPVGTVIATDPDAGATLNYAITAGNTNGAFAINASSGAITVANQSEITVGASFSLTVQVDDGTFNDTATVAVTVDDINEAPVPTAMPSATPSLPENTAVGNTVATIVPNDPEATQNHTFAITAGNTGNAFAIDASGVITVAVSPNFEAGPTSYVLDVQVTDDGVPVLSGTVQVTVTITDVNDAPSIDSTAPTGATEDALYTYNATRSDEDGPGQTWSLLGSDTCPGAAIVSGTGAYTFTPTGPTPPADCVLAIQVCDGGTPDLCATQNATVTITPVNSTPTFSTSIPVTATEDVAYVYNPTISDADGPGQTWTLGGTHTCGGAVNAANGQFSFTPAGPTPATDCVVALQVCDGGTPDECAAQSATVTITAVNDAPVVSTTAPATATEDVAYSYDADLTDADGTGQTWALLGTDDCPGAGIVAGTGVYTFTPAGPTPPPSCTLAIEVCDAGGLCGQQTTTVTITAVNSAPAINSTAPAPATEDTLYTYNATRNDPDGPTQTWSLLGTNTCAGAGIVAGTGVYTFTPAGPTPPADCVVAIQVCDGGTPDECASQSTTIAITAVNDAPTIGSTAPATATEDTLYTYNATATDADGVSQTWSLAGSNTCPGAAIDSGTGAYSFTPTGPNPPASCNVGVQVCDNGTPNECTTQDTTVTISAVNDGPVNVVPAAQVVNEDTDLVFSGGNGNQISIVDGDATTMQVTLTATNGVLSTSGTVGLAFTIGDGTADPTLEFSGSLAAVNTALNGLVYRGTLQYFGPATLTVFSNDQGSTGSGGALTDSDTIDITVSPVNDAPVADDETFDTLGNTELRIDIGTTGTPHVVETTPSTTGVRDGDTDPVETHAFTVTSIVGCGDVTAPYDCTLPSGSLVSMTSDGDFTFRPSPTLATGAHTPDTFQYVITDQPPVGEGTPATDTGLVTIRVFDKIWYVQQGASGNGRSDSPLGNFADIHAVGGVGDDDGPGEVIYVHHNATPLDSFIELEANQVLLGGGAALTTVRSLNGDAPPVLIAAGTDTPVRSTAGNTIRIGNAIPAEIRGLALGTTAAGSNAIDLTTTAATTGTGTLTIADNTFTGATAEGIDVNANSATALTLAITGNAWDGAGTHTGNAIDVNNTNATANALRLNVSNNAGVLSAANAIAIDGGAATRTVVTGFADNTVHGNTGGTGVAISNVTFDANVATGGIQQVDGNALLVGAAGNPTGGGGAAFTASQGNLFFDDLDVLGTSSGLTVSGTGTGLTFAVLAAAPDNSGTSSIDADAGPALDIATAAIDLRLASLQSNTATTGVALNTITGQLRAPNGSQITKASGAGTAFSVTGSNGTVDFGGSLTVTSGGGVSLTSNNAAHSTTFRGGLSLSTGGSAAFHADGGGIVHVCDDDPCNPAATGTRVNTLVTTNGIPLNVVNTTIGSNDLEFRSISSNGASSGIVLNNTGSSGGLWVKGTGGAGTGGTIQNGTSGILMTTTRDVSIDRMQINNHADFGIRGTSVVNFAMANTVVNGTNGNDAGADEGSVRFNELTGTASVTNSTISGSVEHNMQVINTSGLLNRITVTGTTFGPMNNTTGSDGLLIETLNTAVINATVQGNTFTHAIGDHFQFSSNSSTANDVVFTGNTITNTGVPAVSGGGGVRVVGGSNNGTAGTGDDINASATFDLMNNTMRDSRGTAMATNKLGGSGSYSGVIENNSIGVAAVVDSGSVEGSDIFFLHDFAGSTTVAVRNNQSRQYGNYGIFSQTGGSGIVGSGALNATMTGNTVSNPGVLVSIKNGAHLNGGVLPGETYQICFDFGGAGALANSIVGTGTNGGEDFRFRQRQSTSVRLPGYAGGAFDTAAVVAFIQGRNTAGATGSASVAAVNGFTGGAACPQP